MNITRSIADELELVEFFDKTPEIQVYANSNINKYQWRDSRFKEYADVWTNPNYDTRPEIREAIKAHIAKTDNI